MNTAKVVKKLSNLYPGKKILCLPPDSPTEIICEIDPAKDHISYSSAIAVIDESKPHQHLYSTETYEVLEGKLELYVGDNKVVLNIGDKFVIKPGQPHYAVGKETWIKSTSKPGWKPSDHILVKMP